MRTLTILAGILLFTGLSLHAQQSKELTWLSFEDAVAKNQTEPKKFFIDIYTDWCGWCKKMDKLTFQNPVIAEYLSSNYHLVKLDAEQREPIIFQQDTFQFVPQGNRGYHELAAALLQGKMSYPTVVFLDEQMNMIQPLAGFMQPEQIHPILTYFAEDIYKTVAWEEFLNKEYKSPFVQQN